ncbi:MAG: peptide chain release factor N(5)-glutamine methyltransferase, partial [Pseudomonadales bacterium]|nr:peptide chain release factor N(5)-glutamine methyltransferase [Pseudomonadales bacterium]
LALASERAQWDIVATDLSADALAVASENAQRLHLTHVRFHQGAWCDALPTGSFDLLLSNPPYIAPHDVHLQQGDLRFEPASALSAPDSGLADLRTLIEQAPAHLKPGGWLLLEHGYDQGQAVRDLFLDRGYVDVRTLQDFNGLDRVTVGAVSV